MQLFDDRPAGEVRKLTGIYAMLVGFNVAVWVWAFVEFADRPTLLGTALLAYILGLRHAVDADHIAAIDNVVRKLMNENKRPLSAGLFFSLGHSTVVVLATAAIALSAASLQGRFEAFRETGGAIGTAVSAIFLLLIAVINVIILRRVWSSFQHVRRGGFIAEDHLDMLAGGHGPLARLFRPLFGVISKSWHMYPLGFLFGLGFDTATEIGLLGISAAQASQGMSPLLILIFPALFTAGMTLVDTTDGVFMIGAYGWAFVEPLRKLWYNLTITAVSVAVAALIGGIEALGLISSKLNLTGPFWGTINALNDDLAYFGLVIITLFLLSWIISAVIFRWMDFARLARTPRPTPFGRAGFRAR
jgi:nickel/cobalt transporter (NiCoT) family protein